MISSVIFTFCFYFIFVLFELLKKVMAGNTENFFLQLWQLQWTFVFLRVKSSRSFGTIIGSFDFSKQMQNSIDCNSEEFISIHVSPFFPSKHSYKYFSISKFRLDSWHNFNLTNVSLTVVFSILWRNRLCWARIVDLIKFALSFEN